MRKSRRTTNNDFHLYHSNAECDYNNKNRCSVAIDEDRWSVVCFVCWYQFYNQEELRPSVLRAQWKRWQKVGDE